MTIVAFLQNMWVKNPERTKASIEKYGPRYRLKVIAYALFAGCLTGRRLKQALGESLCEQIIWEEANPTIAGNPKDYYPPDAEHIKSVLAEHKPDVVICFTKAGEQEIKSLCTCRFISSPHPAARGADTISKLQAVKEQIEVI
jgi:hypothetical protein